MLFALLYRQKALFSSNQNTYFLHGLAQADVGFLARDWLAMTTDPVPVFSSLVMLVMHWGNAKLFYIEYFLLLGLFAACMLGIAVFVAGGLDKKRKYLPVLFLLILLVDPMSLMTKGMAKQYILGDVLQPSVFGVFLLASIWAFLREKTYLAVLALAIAANVHPTYMLSAGVLATTYLSILVLRKREFKRAFVMALVTALLLTPTLYYVGLNFSPVDAALHTQAQHLLVDFRIPHHAKPAEWVGGRTIIQLMVICAAIYLARSSYLMPIVAVPFVVALTLTIAQWMSGSYTLALLFPWRISIFLMPLSSAILVGVFLSNVLNKYEQFIERHQRSWQIASAVLLAIMTLKGGYNAVRLFQKPIEGRSDSVEFVRATYREGDVVLIPPQLDSFRLAAQVPVFVDFKSHPYQDQEVIEWYKRYQLAQEYYEGKGEAPCAALEQIVKQYGVNRVVLRNANDLMPSSPQNCGSLEQQFSGKYLSVYIVKST